MFCAYCTFLGRQTDWVYICSQFHICLSRGECRNPSHLGLNGGCTFGRAALRDRGKSTPAPPAMVLSVFAKKSVDAASLSQSTFSMSHQCWQQSEGKGLGRNAVNQGLHSEGQEESTSASCSPLNSNTSVQYESDVSNECG